MDRGHQFHCLSLIRAMSHCWELKWSVVNIVVRPGAPSKMPRGLAWELGVTQVGDQGSSAHIPDCQVLLVDRDKWMFNDLLWPHHLPCRCSFFLLSSPSTDSLSREVPRADASLSHCN